jgi:hypothetical protein
MIFEVQILEQLVGKGFDFFNIKIEEKIEKDAAKTWRKFFEKVLKEKELKIKYTIRSPKTTSIYYESNTYTYKASTRPQEVKFGKLSSKRRN